MPGWLNSIGITFYLLVGHTNHKSAACSWDRQLSVQKKKKLWNLTLICPKKSSKAFSSKQRVCTYKHKNACQGVPETLVEVRDNFLTFIPNHLDVKVVVSMFFTAPFQMNILAGNSRRQYQGLRDPSLISFCDCGTQARCLLVCSEVIEPNLSKVKDYQIWE